MQKQKFYSLVRNEKLNHFSLIERTGIVFKCNNLNFGVYSTKDNLYDVIELSSGLSVTPNKCKTIAESKKAVTDQFRLILERLEDDTIIKYSKKYKELMKEQKIDNSDVGVTKSKLM